MRDIPPVRVLQDAQQQMALDSGQPLLGDAAGGRPLKLDVDLPIDPDHFGSIHVHAGFTSSDGTSFCFSPNDSDVYFYSTKTLASEIQICYYLLKIFIVFPH